MPISENIKTAIMLYIRKIGYPYLNEYVFKSQKGKNNPLDVSSVRNIFNTMAINLGLPYHPQRIF